MHHGERRPHGSRATLRKSVGNTGTVGIAGAFPPKAPKISIRRIVHIPEKHSFTGRFAATDASVPTTMAGMLERDNFLAMLQHTYLIGTLLKRSSYITILRDYTLGKIVHI